MAEPVFSGSVDRIGRDRVYGWLALGDNEPGRGWVSIVVEGVTLRSGVADLYREDLREAGFGDGCAGYDFVFAPGEIAPGSTLSLFGHAGQRGEAVLLATQVVDAPAELELAGAGEAIAWGVSDEANEERIDTSPLAELLPVTGQHASTPQSHRSTGSDMVCVHVDVTDLLFYVLHHRNVSGIQRVQCGYIANLLHEKNPGIGLRFCLSAAGRTTYVDLPVADVRYLMQEMRSSRIADYKDWQTYILRLMAFETKAPAAFEPGDIVLVMGAPWVYPDYHKAIAAAKRDFGVRYFQISYDMIPSFLPEHCDAALVVVFNAAVAGMLRYADHVFAISQHSAQDFVRLAQRCNLPSPPVSVIPMGGTIDYNETAGEREALLARGPDRSLDGFFKSHGLGEFVLCVSTIESRKNHAYLYQVWKRLTEVHGPDTPKLVLVGRLGWHIESLQRFLKISNWLGGRIVHLTEVTDRELQELYHRCLFTVFPSFYEGWGLPVGESLYYGKLPVASGATSMPEVGQGWAVYIDPFNIDDGFRHINDLLTDRGKLRALEDRIINDYQPISWHAAAQTFLGELTALAPIQVAEAEPAAIGPVIELATSYEFGDIVRRREAVQAEATVLDQFRVFTLREILDGDDWFDAEPWGCWTRGDTARLCLRLVPDIQAPMLAYIGVCLPPWFPETFCGIILNGVSIGRRLIPTGGRTKTLRVPITSSPLHGDVVQIVLTLERMSQPVGPGSEPRPLGIGVQSLFVSHQSDFEARLTYLEERISG